jgi:hypothetical protein
MDDDRPTSTGTTAHPFPITIEGQLAAVLWLVWDPVGGNPDEYAVYVPAILSLIRQGADGPTLETELARIRREALGQRADPILDRHAAWRILDWYGFFVDADVPPRFGRVP